MLQYYYNQLTKMTEGFREIITSAGSRYKRLGDGTTQRFKSATNNLLKPQDAIVFIPPYDELKLAAPEGINFEGVYGENEIDFRQIILAYMDKGHTITIVDEKGDLLYTNQKINESERVFLKFGKKGEKDFLFIPVSKTPKIGYQTFDTSKYLDENGEAQIARHIGNEIIEILT